MKQLIVFLLAIALGLGFNHFVEVNKMVYADPPAVCCGEPLPEIFTVAPYGQLDQYNPLSKKVRATGVVRWAYQVMPGCSGGDTIGQNIGAAMGDIYDKTGLAFVYVTDGSQDLTLYDDCGLTFSNRCGGPPVIACLFNGFPYNLDIDFSSDMATFYDLSQQSIVLHELAGHAAATWNEGYCTGYGQPVSGCTGQFAAVPGYQSIMNTGPDSRHLLGSLELAQWGRTQGSGLPARFGKDDGFIYLCNIPAKAVNVALYGWDGATYRYIGSVPVSLLHAGSDGCVGIGTAGYVRADEAPCFDLWNAVDTAQQVFRSDRCL